MLRVVKIQGSEKSFQQEGFSFAKISDEKEISDNSLGTCDALLIDNPSAIASICSALRRHPETSFALKPIFHCNSVLNDQMTDGYFSGSSDDYRKIELINSKIREIEYDNVSLNEGQSLRRLTQYLFTRNTILEPYNNRLSSIGYLFPFLNSYIDITKQSDAIELVFSAEQQGYFSGKVRDRIHQCKSCKGNYLNFRESCPSCYSIDITPKDLVHHFVCAHVAEEETFFKDDEMQCPKCDRKMRHIGIDYDKPSSVYTCNCCQNQFQEPEMKAFCLDCQTEQNLEELQESVIKEYALTTQGEEFAKYGKQQSGTSKESANISLFLFKILCEQELERMKNKNVESFLLDFELSKDLFHKFDSKTKDLLKTEIEKIISNYVLGSDSVASKNFNHIQVLLTDYQQSKAEELRSLIEVNLNKLLTDNLPTTSQVVKASLELLSEKSLKKQ